MRLAAVELARLGHNVAVIMPPIGRCNGPWPADRADAYLKFDIPIGQQDRPRPALLSGTLAGLRRAGLTSSSRTTTSTAPELYRRQGRGLQGQLRAVRLLLPGGAGGDPPAATCEVDVVHCQRLADRPDPGLSADRIRRTCPATRTSRSLFTIHNLAYQGIFWHWDMLLTGLDWKYFNWHQMEFFGKLNLLKTGLVFADRLNTVSPRYAEEIQSDPLGCGLEGVLQQRRDVLCGIVNGVDYASGIRRPIRICRRSTTSTNVAARARRPARRRCRRSWACRSRRDAPLVGFVGRLADQKGWDLVADVMRRLGARRTTCSG